MLKTVILAENPFEPTSWSFNEVDDVTIFLMTKYPQWPQNARIYDKYVASSCDVTPCDENGVKKLKALDGPFYVVIYPGDPLTIIIAAVALIASIAITIFFRPAIPTTSSRQSDSPSPNNGLSERQNSVRMHGRIPDIFGTVRSVPDLIAQPYKIFVNNEEVEHAYMCIGRGYYDVSDIRDDTTLASDIPGTTVEIYSPFTSPQSGHDPQILIGLESTEPLRTTKRYTAVNGQTLLPPNGKNYTSFGGVFFVAPNKIQASGSSSIDFTQYFQAGQALDLKVAFWGESALVDTNCVYTLFPLPAFVTSPARIRFDSGATVTADWIGRHITLVDAVIGDPVTSIPLDFSGTYLIESIDAGTNSIYIFNPWVTNWTWQTFTESESLPIQIDGHALLPTGAAPDGDLKGDDYQILSVTSKIITLNNPQLINSSWSNIVSHTPKATVILDASGPAWVGPFVLDNYDLREVIANFVAPGGLYADNGQSQYSRDVTVEIELTPINPNGTTRGPPETFQATLFGSGVDKSQKAITLIADPTFTGLCRVRARRVSNTIPIDGGGTVVDEVQWRDVYMSARVVPLHFGNVTTVRSITYATEGALAIKERKLNMLVTRRLPRRISGSIFSTSHDPNLGAPFFNESQLYATNRIDEIISAVCLDPFIGRRTLDEIDFDNIYDTVLKIEEYFGTDVAAEFSYTFDKDNLSFEETVASLASVIFSTAYRRGNKLQITFEKETVDSVLLFNHRNKLPASEIRTVRFGPLDNHDGIELTYVSPDDDTIDTFVIPDDYTAMNPKKIETIGIRTKLQARFQAYRSWNKINYQTTIVEFDATQEADLLLLLDRILVADNTRPETQDGEVLEQNGLELTTSQDVHFSQGTNYTIFLQLLDATVQSIPISEVVNAPNKVLLSQAPRLPLVVDPYASAKTIYKIVGSTDSTESRPSTFLVSEKQQKTNFTSNIKAVNYDDRYYANDFDYKNGIVDIDGNPI